MALMRACVYGWRAVDNTERTGPSSTSLPAYMMPMRSEKCFAVAKSWVMYRKAIPKRSWI